MALQWAFIGFMFLIGLALPSAAIIANQIIAPRKPSKTKSEIYECGMETVGETWVQFKVQYYIYALVFLVFDIETAFLFPWAVAFDALPLFAVLEGVIFILILVGGLLYAWRKGALEWS